MERKESDQHHIKHFPTQEEFDACNDEIAKMFYDGPIWPEQALDEGWDEKYESEAKKLNIFSYSAQFDEEVQGRLSGISPRDVIGIYNRIKPCKCGADNPKALENECMGDYSFSIICNKCGRKVTRSMYDYDVRELNGEIDLCIRDWNNEFDQEEIDAAQEAENERVQIKQEDVIWEPLHPNNMLGNPVEGYYTLLFRKQYDGKIFGFKWTIVFQYEEIDYALSGDNINAYILFGKDYTDLEKPFSYPEPREKCMFINDYDTGCIDGVNDYGNFYYAYKTLEDAKEGALTRCARYGIDRDTIIKHDGEWKGD